MDKSTVDVIRDFLMGERKFDTEVYSAIRKMYLSVTVKEETAA